MFEFLGLDLFLRDESKHNDGRRVEAEGMETLSINA